MRYQILTPPVNNQVATTVVTPIVTNDSSSSDRDSAYYHDLMNQYHIDEQYAKTKSDKAKAQKLYQYSYKRYKQEKHSEKILGYLAAGIIVVSIIFIIFLIISW